MNTSTQNLRDLVSVKDYLGSICSWGYAPLCDSLVADHIHGILEVDPSHVFDLTVTRTILAAFHFNLRVLVQGHGTGKTSHIQQASAHLNYPCPGINLDEHISKLHDND